MKVPLLDLGEHHKPINDALLEALKRVLASNSFILGAEVEKLEKRVAGYCKTPHAVGVSSGTDALLVSLMALGVGFGDEVVTTPYSFFATAGSIVRLGARPVMADISPDSFNMDPKLIEPAISARTKAILPVHLFGQCADMGPIMETAERLNLPVVEDAAQAIGAEYKDGRRAGSMGATGCFSFFPTKNLGALGDAGMVVCRDAGLAEKIRMLRMHGDRARYQHVMVGGNFRLDALQAAALNVKIEFLDGWTKKRRENAARYNRLFSESGLPDKAGIRLPPAVYGESGPAHGHIYNQYVIRAPARDRLRDYLAAREIGTAVYYPIPLHLQECFRDLGYKKGQFPESERAAAETLALPVYPELTVAQLEYVVASIRDFYSA